LQLNCINKPAGIAALRQFDFIATKLHLWHEGSMNCDGHAASTVAPRAPRRVKTVRDIASISAIFEPELNIVVHRGERDQRLEDEVQRLVQQSSFALMMSVSPDLSGLTALRERLRGMSCLVEDVFFWIGVLAELTECHSVGVRLTRLQTAMCPGFHVDKVTVRVVSTLYGRGTEYLDGSHTCSAGLGDVLFLKGEHWPGNTGNGAVHRSPVASADEPRLVLTLDALWFSR
jgi:hypothetical protein